VTFDYLANLRKLKKKLFEGWAGVRREGVLINERPNQGIRERKMFGRRRRHNPFVKRLINQLINCEECSLLGSGAMWVL
jgi:hypothetical protein